MGGLGTEGSEQALLEQLPGAGDAARGQSRALLGGGCPSCSSLCSHRAGLQPPLVPTVRSARTAGQGCQAGGCA